jgi:hypothetical protein
MRYEFERDPAQKERIIQVRHYWVSDPRKLFEKHQDFPAIGEPVDESLQKLRWIPQTRNGDYSLYALISMKLDEALDLINKIPGTSIPRNPASLRSRKGLLHVTLQTIVNLYRCSSRSPTIGGEVSSLGISPNGYVE